MIHRPLTRDCSALDLYSVVGGVACGNCGASSAPKMPPGFWCASTTADGKDCPLQAEHDDGLCSYHRMHKRQESV